MGRAAFLTGRPIAHRGFHDAAAGRIENTLSAADAAIARNFAIECDLQLSGDGEAVVFHDDTLDRLTDATGPIHGKPLAELKSATIKGTGDRIPTLAELLGLVAGRVPLVIELKPQAGAEPLLEQRTVELLHPYEGPLAVMSFDPRSVRAMRSLAPALPRGMVADRFDEPGETGLSWGRRMALRHLLHAQAVRPDFIAYDINALPANAPLFLRHLGLPLLTWTVRTPAERALADRYADQIIFEGFDPAMDTAQAVSD
ncbi:MAG: glycerophosphodiester phosphodiesterase [Bauldia sp.]|uniref:glycerophosphodiester phosphodiesterase family protein n=1 Tax=Bauldia sp. TaxID=2575872 RepID=UPI001D304EE6|nr:glycerophosphodiester phosphodiesterase family protein [Bauldia sp.]MCB1495757.1 glycerophosphodiester phosphodiesterase [Bauldia sp.]